MQKIDVQRHFAVTKHNSIARTVAMGNSLCASHKANVSKPVQLTLVVVAEDLLPAEIHSDDLRAAIAPEEIVAELPPITLVEPFPEVVAEPPSAIITESPQVVEVSPVVVEPPPMAMIEPSPVHVAKHSTMSVAKPFPTIITVPKRKVQFDAAQLIREKTFNREFDNRRSSSPGHQRAVDLFVQQMGMELIVHERLEYIGKKKQNVQYRPDGLCKWMPYPDNLEYAVSVYWEVKCVDSKRQRENYYKVKQQCEKGQRLKRRQKNINQDKLLFVGFAQRGATLELMICLGKLHAHFLAQFERHISSLVSKNRNYIGRE